MKRSAFWIGLAALATLVLAFRLQISFDISAFFPQETDMAHEILLEQFQSGPGSRILVVGVNGPDRELVTDLNDQMRSELAESPLFSNVVNGELSGDVDALPEPIASYYHLMRDIEYTKSALQSAVDARLRDLALGGGTAMLQLFARDPFLATMDILDRLAPASMTGEMWMARDGSAVLLVETHATAVDIAGQAKAVAKVREVFSSLSEDPQIELEITGAGAFGVELQKTIRAEAKKRSLLASAALICVLFVFYRSPRYVLLASLPIAMGFLLGLTAVSLIFDSVHGITLAFGFTLMGVAIDYPLHLFSHAEVGAGDTAIARIWPTMRLGALSTAVAYVALAFSGSDGLAQLGIFTAVGIVVAVLVTRFWLPQLIGKLESPASTDAARFKTPLKQWPALLAMVVAIGSIAAIATEGIWDDRLTSLSPVPPERLLRDVVLRSAASTPDMGYQIVLYDPSLDNLLRRSERLDRLLQMAVDDELLDSWQSVTQVLGSAETQERRRVVIPDGAALRGRLVDVLSTTPFRPDAFEAFVTTAERARESGPITIDQIRGTPLRSWLDSRLIKVGAHWVAMVSVSNLSATALAERVSDWGDGIQFMDLQASSASLMRDYRIGAATTVSVAALLILAMLWYQRRQIIQVVWITLTVTSVLAATIAVVVGFHGQLTVIHLVALLLVIGLGLDYALFLSRTETHGERLATDKAVLACAVSTTLAFGFLAGSSIPVLKFLGLTVAAGSALSYGFAIAGSRLWPANTT